MTEKPTLPQNPPNARLEKFSSKTWQYIAVKHAQTVSLYQRTQVTHWLFGRVKENKKNPAYDPCANIRQRPPKGSNKHYTKSFFLSLKIPDLVHRSTVAVVASKNR